MSSITITLESRPSIDVTLAAQTTVDITATQCTVSAGDATVENQAADYSETVAAGGTHTLPFMKVKQSDGSTVNNVDYKQAIDGFAFEADICPTPADATVENQAADYSETVASGGTHTLPFMKVKQSDGSTVTNVDYKQAADGFAFEADLCGAGGLIVSVGLSDTTPNFGDSVTITITSSGTPTSYRFWLPVPDGYQLITQASNTYVWTVGAVGSVTVHGGANEATATGYSIAGVSATVTGYLLDGLINEPNKATSFRLLTTAYAALPIVNIRRSSDNATADFTAAEITDGTLTTWTGANDGLVTRRYDQAALGHDDFQTTAAYQPKLVSAGTLITDSNGNPVGEIVSTTQAMRFYAFAQGEAGTVYASYKPLGGAHAGRYYYVVSKDANPRIGMSDDNETSTLATSTSSGTPTTKVNGSEISPEQAGAMGTATLNNECIVTIKDIDWSGHIQWISAIPEIFEWCDVGSNIGDMILYINTGTEQQAYIEAEMNAYYGYY